MRELCNVDIEKSRMMGRQCRQHAGTGRRVQFD
jgi:hypothetical protein